MRVACLTSQRTVADLEGIITLRFQHRENALIVECDALRGELIDAHSRTESAWQSVHGADAEATQAAVDEMSIIVEMRAERDAALQEIAYLRTQVTEQQQALRVLQNGSSRSTRDADASESPEQQQPKPTQGEEDARQST